MGRPEVEVTEIVDGEQASPSPPRSTSAPSSSCPSTRASPSQVDDAEVTDERRRRGGRPSCAASSARSPTVERAAADGDVLLVDIAGSRDGEPVEDLSGLGAVVRARHRRRAARLRRGRARRVGRRDPHLHLHPRGRRARGPGRRGRRSPSPRCASGCCPTPTTTSRCWPASSTPSTSCAPTSARASSVRPCSLQGAEARNKLHDALLDLVDIPLPEGVIAAEVDDHFAARPRRPRGHRTSTAPRSRTAPARRSRASSSWTASPTTPTSPSARPSCRPGWCSRRRATACAPHQFAQALVRGRPGRHGRGRRAPRQGAAGRARDRRHHRHLRQRRSTCRCSTTGSRRSTTCSRPRRPARGRSTRTTRTDPTPRHAGAPTGAAVRLCRGRTPPVARDGAGVRVR